MNQNAGRSKMSKFWWSGEVQADVADTYTEAMKAVDAELNRLLNVVSFGGKVDEWAFIAIIREGNSPDYREIARKSSRGKSLEFRLKISHTDFLAAHAGQRISLIFKALSRSVLMMENLEVSTDTRRTLQAVLFQAENALVSGVVWMSKPGDGVFYDSSRGAFRGRDEIYRIARAIKATHPDFQYQPISEPEELRNGGRVKWVAGRPGAPPSYARTDFLIARDGRICRALFFDKLPQLDSAALRNCIGHPDL